MSGFPFHKLAPLPWKVMPGGTGISCSDEKGSKVCATRAGHAFPERGERESQALAQAIALRVNVFDDLLATAKLFEQTIEFAIRVAEAAGDDEGARLKSITLQMVRATIARAENA
ncbi:hypothetical protein [Mesorhizobium sp.]|uniref:hypothetical protein n=1 Tax=Mesorhizobium sp. TaxID=1871066 RepID=UPI000FE5D25B|nr:hypothetical protein [Mesorhizobium sp.]RWO23325.1 MAG: hypothetical protein EOS09_17005 [Mesorhizobium sp.]